MNFVLDMLRLRFQCDSLMEMPNRQLVNVELDYRREIKVE